MHRLADNIVQFFQDQGFAIVSTIDRGGVPHNSCKGIVSIRNNNSVYLLDLYKKKTYNNLRGNSHISITAVNEHKFLGYCLKGKAKILTENKFSPYIIKAWEKKVTSRLTSRLIKNIKGEKGHLRHPEALLPRPEYLIVMKVEGVVDLTPQNIK